MKETTFKHPQTGADIPVKEKQAFGKVFYSFNDMDWRQSKADAFEAAGLGKVNKWQAAKDALLVRIQTERSVFINPRGDARGYSLALELCRENKAQFDGCRFSPLAIS